MLKGVIKDIITHRSNPTTVALGAPKILFAGNKVDLGYDTFTVELWVPDNTHKAHTYERPFGTSSEQQVTFLNGFVDLQQEQKQRTRIMEKDVPQQDSF